MEKKIFILIALAGLAVGCAPLHPSGCHKTTATGSCGSGRWDDQDEALRPAIKAAINAKLVAPQSWKGKNADCISSLLRMALLQIFRPVMVIKHIVKR
jgi:hypothetical protein